MQNTVANVNESIIPRSAHPLCRDRVGPISEYLSIGNIVKFSSGRVIVLENDAMTFLYEIVSGTVKSYKILKDGRRLVTGFYTRGDVIGLPIDATHLHTVEAVTDTTLRCFKQHQLEGLVNSSARFLQKIVKMSYQRLSEASDHLVTLGRKNPEERVATFLLGCEKWSVIQLPPSRSVILLPMSRLDIADYLGLTQETVCRVLSKFKRAGLISLSRADQLILQNKVKLAEIAKIFDEKTEVAAYNR